MSGICGVVRYDGAPVDPEQLKALAEKASYRGQGGIHYWVQGSIGLGYLASHPSLNLSSGICQDDRLVLVADARLDNRTELARLLATHGCLAAEAPTDSELFLAAYACWGPGCCEHLRGAYSLACWNEADSSLFLLRDRLGERALYWCTTPEAIFFASEPAQLLAVESSDPAPNLERVLAYLLKQSFDPAWSFFRAIQRLPEAHYLICRDRQVTQRRYWSPQDVKQQGLSRGDAAEALSHALELATTRRLASEGESGVLLSGGLDSSSLAAKASTILERQSKRLFAFTWESRTGDKLDERKRSAALVAARMNIVERPVLADERYPLSRYPEAYNDPNAPDTNAYPDLLLETIEKAQQHDVEVLMNGMGGDPVIGAFMPELAFLRQGRLGVLAERLRKSGRHSLMLLVRQIRAAAIFDLPSWISPEGRRLAHQAGLDRPAPWAQALQSSLSLRAYLLARPLNGMHLERFDRFSARQGVRLVAPWYDLDLVTLVLSQQDGALDLHPPGKSLLRQAMAGNLPESLLAMPIPRDMASALPANGLLKHRSEQIMGWLRCSILGQLGLVDSPGLLAAYQQAAQSARMMPRIWEIITLEIWLQLHYNNKVSCPK